MISLVDKIHLSFAQTKMQESFQANASCVGEVVVGKQVRKWNSQAGGLTVFEG